jgi:hypothetical protein
MLRDVQVEEFAAVMSKDDEDEEQAKREGRDEEEVDGHNISGMGGEKRAPRGRRSRRRPMHVPRDREFGDAVAEQGQDPVPSRQMGSAHRPLEDQELMAQRQFSRATAADPKNTARRKVQKPISPERRILQARGFMRGLLRSR